MILRPLLTWAALTLQALAADPITAISWNVESGGADPAVIAKQLGELPKTTVYALQEVHGDDIARYGDAIRQAHGESYRYYAGWTGLSDRQMLAYDSARLHLVTASEFFGRYNDDVMNDWRHRSPLHFQFTDKHSGAFFYLYVVHLAGGDALLRESQARALYTQVRNQPLFWLAVGDFNFEYSFHTKRGGKAYDLLTAEEQWKWAKPKTLVDTYWSDQDGDGNDDYPDSCRDFVFYHPISDRVRNLHGSSMPAFKAAWDWTVTSEVIVRPGDFPDDERTSDHRPVMATIELPEDE